MRFNVCLLIAMKEMREIIARSKLILSTVIGFPILLGVVMPTIFGVIMLPLIGEGSPGYFIPPLFPNWDLISPGGQFYIFFINIYSGMFNLILPLMIPVYIAADSFAGEKERKTLEPILAAPVSDIEILIGKSLTSLIPALTASLVAICLSTVSINLISYGIFGFIIYPVLPIIILYVFAIPLMSLLTVFSMVIVSSKVQKVREASQLGGIVIIPILLLFFTQIFGVLSLSVFTEGLFILLVLCLVVILIFAGLKIFNRQRLIESI